MNDNKPLTKLQKKYINIMMNTKVKKTEEFNTDVMKETHKKQMKEIREKYSPNGGRKPFKTSDDRQDYQIEWVWITSDNILQSLHPLLTYE